MKDNSKEVLFGEILKDLKKEAEDKGNKISKRRIEDAFGELYLDSVQIELVYDYLKKQGISVISDIDKSPDDIPQLSGDKSALDTFLTAFLKNIEDMARIYKGQGVLFEDLTGEGNLAVIEAAALLSNGPLGKEEEDLLSGFFARKVMLAMEDAVNEHAAAKDRENKVLSHVKKVGEAATELSDLMRRKISVEELMLENTEFSEEEIRAAIRLSGGTIDVV